MRAVAGSLALLLVVLISSGRAADAPADLALMAGEWVADFSLRAGQKQVPAEVLAKLTLKIEKDQWTQSFGKDVATFTLVLDPAQGTMAMHHNRTGVVLNTTYELNGDKLTVTRIIDQQPLDTEVKVWLRKGKKG